MNPFYFLRWNDHSTKYQNTIVFKWLALESEVTKWVTLESFWSTRTSTIRVQFLRPYPESGKRTWSFKKKFLPQGALFLQNFTLFGRLDIFSETRHFSETLQVLSQNTKFTAWILLERLSNNLNLSCSDLFLALNENYRVCRVRCSLT